MVKRLVLAVILASLVIFFLAGCGTPKSAQSTPAEKASISTIYQKVANLENYTATISGKVDNQQDLLNQINQKLADIQKQLTVLANR